MLAGGAESMSQAEYYSTALRWGARAGDVDARRTASPRGRVTAGGVNYPVPGGMIETAENLRREYAISREEQDELALRSHQRAVAAQRARRFAEEIVPVDVAPASAARRTIDTDEHPRADTTLEQLAALRPVMRAQDPEATVTAGNASGQNDGAAVCIVTTPSAPPSSACGRWPGWSRWAVAGVPPRDDGHRPGAGDRQGARRAPA